MVTRLDFSQEDTLYLTHGIHPYPARFPPQLVRWAIENFTEEGELVLDPMVGSGTTLVECAANKRKSIGIDIDPLARLISMVKTTPIKEHSLQVLMNMVDNNMSKLHFNASTGKGIILPGVNNLYIWFLPQVAVELALLKETISALKDDSLRKLCMVALSSLIIAKDSVSNARDIVQTRPHVVKKDDIPDVFNRFRRRVRQTIDAINKYSDKVTEGYAPTVMEADARRMPLGDGIVDLIVFSPPYINALDYPRSHKFSIWWLDGLLLPEGIDSYNRLQPFFIGTDKVPLEECYRRTSQRFHVESLDRAISDISKNSIQKSGVVHRFFGEMEQVLRECIRVLKYGKCIVLVIGDNTIGGVKLKTANLLIDFVENILGSHLVVENKIVRKIDRSRRKFPVHRGNRAKGMKRETVLVLRKRG